MRPLHRAAVLIAIAVFAGHERMRCVAEQRMIKEGTCRSVGGLKFDPAQRSMQRSKGLEVCSQYKKNTCCNETHMRPLRLKIREPVVAKFNMRCQKFTEEMVCSSCHPLIGTQRMKTVCPRLCAEWYSACRNEFYSYSSSGSLSPCYGNALICSPLSKIAESGAEFCSKMGYHVGNEDDSEGDDCFDGSVPRQLGDPEPSEPWQDWLQRLFAEQSDDPSGVFIFAMFAPVFAIYVVYQVAKRITESPHVTSGRRQLTLEQVRALQQLKYEGGATPADYESDSSDPYEDGGEERCSDIVEDSVDEVKDASVASTDDIASDKKTTSS